MPLVRVSVDLISLRGKYTCQDILTHYYRSEYFGDIPMQFSHIGIILSVRFGYITATIPTKPEHANRPYFFQTILRDHASCK